MIMLGGWCGVFLLTVWVSIRRIQATGAVPAAEFAPAAATYAALPVLLTAALLLCALGAWRLRAPVARLGCGLAAGGALWPPLLVPGVLLIGIGCACRLPAGERLLPQPRARRLVLALLSLCALAAAATLLLALIESFAYVPRFVPRLVTPGQLQDYRVALGGLSFHFGVQIGLVAVLCIGLAGLIARGRPLLLCLLLGQVCGAALVVILRLTLGDEVDQIGIRTEVVLLGVLLGGLLSGVVWRRVRTLPHGDTLDFTDAFFRHVLVPPVRFHTLATLGVGLAVFALLSMLLYPALEDFRAEIFDSYATLATLLATLLLYMLAPRRRAWVSSAVLLAGMLAMALTLSSDSRVRIVAHEYSRMGALAGNSWLERALDPFPRIGYHPVPGVEFVHHPGGGERLPPPPHVEGLPLLVFLIWDGARPDRMSAYGYERRTTPFLEQLAQESVRFTNAYSNATATTVAVRKLLSGRYSTRYMLAQTHDAFLTKELSEIGYRRFLITVTGTDHNGVSGEAFERGWDADPTRFVRITTDNRDAEKPDRAKTEAVIRRLKDWGDLTGTFVYLHLTGTHFPWFDRHYGGSTPDRYDGEMRKCDRLLGDLRRFLKGRRYILVMTADHGTGLGEHGRFAGFQPYEEQIRVPLLMRIPGVEPRVVDDFVAHIDVAPTVVNLFRAGPHRFHGRSLLPLLSGITLAPRPIVCFNAFRDDYAILDGHARWKLFHDRGRRYEALFDLERDPHESHNRIGDEGKVGLRLRRLLGAFLWQGRDSYGNPYHYREWKGAGR